MDTADMKKLLIVSKRQPVHCGVGMTKDGVVLLLDKIKPPRALVKDLEKQFPDMKSPHWGTAVVDTDEDPKLVILTLNKAAPGMARRMKKTLKGTGFTKVEIHLEDGSVADKVGEEDEEGAEGAAPAAPPSVAPVSAPPLPPVTYQPDKPEDDPLDRVFSERRGYQDGLNEEEANPGPRGVPDSYYEGYREGREALLAPNPYKGTTNEVAWRRGYDAGFKDPRKDHSAPEGESRDFQHIYGEGVLAGREAGNARLRIADKEFSPEDHASGKVQVGKTAATYTLEIIGDKVVKGHWGFTPSPLVILIELVLEEESPPYFSEAASQLMVDVRDALQESGKLPPGLELFMAACPHTHVGLSTDDVMAERGWWHGDMYTKMGDAEAEASRHEHPDDAVVLRFKLDNPTIVDYVKGRPK
jgi:hypothetical protein